MAVGIAGIGLAHEDRDLTAWVRRTSRPPLAAVDDVVIAVSNDRTFDICSVGGGDGWFGHGEAGANAALEQRLQPLFLLLLRAVEIDRLHIAGIGRRAVEGFRGHERPTHDLAKRRVVEIGETGAMLGMS